MSNRILGVHVRDRSLDPAQAELWLTADVEHVTATTELRGRLAGPRCLYAATVEVAYPLRPFLRQLAGRVVIPEPCLWEPQCPFVYQGSIELWVDGLRCDQVEIRRGLRRILLGPRGLRVNGRPLSLRGREATGWDEAEASALRRGGVNLLIVAADAPPVLWELADWHGLFVLARMRTPDSTSLARAQRQADHPSCFGWLLEPPFDRWKADFVKKLRCTGGSVGVEFAETSAVSLPAGIDFIARPAGAAIYGRALGLPLLLLGEGPESPDVFGRVE